MGYGREQPGEGSTIVGPFTNRPVVQFGFVGAIHESPGSEGNNGETISGRFVNRPYDD